MDKYTVISILSALMAVVTIIFLIVSYQQFKLDQCNKLRLEAIKSNNPVLVLAVPCNTYSPTTR